jgi:hypothetical protein
MERVRRLLGQLECPFALETDDTSLTSVVQAIAWLEDRVVRVLDVGEREPLRSASEHWHEVFSAYLLQVGSPLAYPGESLVKCLDWLVSHAVALEYEDYG